MKNVEKRLDEIRVEISEDSILNTLQKDYPEVYDLLDFSEMDLADKLSKNSFHCQHYRLLQLKAENLLVKAEESFAKKQGEEYNKLKFEDSRGLSKVEIEKYYLTNNDDLKLLRRVVAIAKTRVMFFESIVESFKTQNWAMKNVVDLLKTGF